jgi:ribonuclease P protein component
MFFYQTNRLSYEEINTKTIQLFEKFIAQNGKSNPVEIDKDLKRIISLFISLKEIPFF